MNRRTHIYLPLFTIAAITLTVIQDFNVLAAPATGPAAMYTGRVVGPDEKPVTGARVDVYDSVSQASAAPLASTKTDSQGQFQLSRPAQRFTVVVQAAGFGLNVTMLAADVGIDDPLEIYLKPASIIRLSAIHSDGKPASGVVIAPQALREMQTGSYGGGIPPQLREQLAKTTDDSGGCIFTDLPQQSIVSFRIIDPQHIGDTIGVETTAQPVIDAPPIRVEAGVIIEGRVVRPDNGEPLANISVSDGVNVAGASNYSTGATTDAEGKYRFTQLHAGEHKLSVLLPSPVSAEYVAQPRTITASPGQHLSNIDMKLVSGVAIHGKATAADSGKPIEGAHVSAGTSLTGIPGLLSPSGSTAITGSDGSYTMRVMPGQYTVRISNLASHGYLLPRPNGQPVTVGVDGETTVDFQCNADPSPPLKGRVVDEKGKPVEGASATASFPTSGGSVGNAAQRPERTGGSATTDTDGKFVIPFVTDGAMLRVKKGSARLARQITINSINRDLNLELVKVPQGSLLVHIIDDAGKPVAGVRIAVMSGGTEIGRLSGASAGITKLDGTFRITSLDPDVEYTVNAEAKGYTWEQLDRIKVEPGKETDAPPLKLNRAESYIEGIVQDEAGQPIAGASVTLSSPGVSISGARTDLIGHFRIDGIVAGSSVSVMTRVDGRSGQPQRVQAGTENAIIVFKLRTYTTGPAARRGQ